MGCDYGELMKTNGGRAKVLGLFFALILCLAVPLSMAQNAKAGAAEYSSNITSLPEAREYSGVIEDEGKLYVIGGVVDDINVFGAPLTSVLIYEISTGEVTHGADMPIGVALASVTQGVDGRIYVIGGYNNSLGYTSMTQIYNITSDTWSSGAPTPVTIGPGAAVSVANGTIYVIGANPFNGNSTLAYDPVADSWKYVANQPSSIWGRRAVYWNESAIFVMGGRSGGGASSSLMVFDPLANTWTPLTSMPTASFSGGAATALNGVVYYFGGSDSSWVSGTQISAIQKYDPTEDTWSTSTITSLSPARSGFGTAIDEMGRIFAVGGYDGSAGVPTVTMIVPTDLVYDKVEIVSPTEGSIVSGQVAIGVAYSTPNVGMPVIEVFVDGVFLGSQTAPWFSSTITYLWDTTGLADGSSHVITAKGTLWNGAIREDSVTVTVSSMSPEEQLASIQQQLTVLQTLLTIPDANLTALAMQAAILQAKLDGIIAGLGAMGASSSVMWDQLNVTFAALQTQLNDFQTQIDRVENKADNAGTYSIVNLVLVIIVIVLLALMLMMVRKKP
jgi:N-acetylneuraminic acid mutarotase